MAAAAAMDGIPCPHLRHLNLDKLRKKFSDADFLDAYKSKSLKCTGLKCPVARENESGSLWMCLADGCKHIGCGRDQEQHAIYHFEQNKTHTLCYGLNSRALWCYACDTDVEVDGELFTTLSSIFSQLDSSGMDGPSASSVSSSFYPSSASSSSLSASEDPSADGASSPGPMIACGLNNIGNTCYFAASFQSLAHCTPLTRFFLNCREYIEYRCQLPRTKHVDQLRRNLLQDVSNLLTEMHSNPGRSVNPRNVVADIQQLYAPFRGFGQQDAEECIRELLDHMHEELKTELTDSKQLIEHYNSSSDAYNRKIYSFIEKVNLRNWNSEVESLKQKGKIAGKKDYPPKPRYSISPIADVFEGYLLSQVKCSACGVVSKTVDSFFDLNVNIPNADQLHRIRSSKPQLLPNPLQKLEEKKAAEKQGFLTKLYKGVTGFVKKTASSFSEDPKTLSECLEAFCLSEELSGSNRYKCENCKVPQDATKSLSILKLPEIMCVHIKRFSFESAWTAKINEHIEFQSEMDMATFCALDPELGIDKHSNTKYKLIAVINHHGGYGGGHYTSYCWDESSSCWLECNDSSVSRANPQDVLNSQAYVLFYKRVESKIQEKVDERIRLKQMRSGRAAGGTAYISRWWLQKHKTFSHPGPILNFLPFMICQHGRLLPRDGSSLSSSSAGKAEQAKLALKEAFQQFYKPVPVQVWDMLSKKYGGSSAPLSTVDPCAECIDAAQVEKDRRLQKRDEEVKYVVMHDKVKTTDGDGWYIVDAAWVQSWREFLEDSKGNTPPPGPISNARLLDPHTHQPLPGLEKGKQYKGLNKFVYEFAYEQYGGGPHIIRKTIDIYTPEFVPYSSSSASPVSKASISPAKH